MNRSTRQIAALLAGVLVIGPARTEEVPSTPVLAEMPLGEFAEIHSQRHVLTVELRADTAIAVAMFPLAQRPDAFTRDDIGADCLAVFIIDDASAAEEVAAAAARFGAAGCELRRLSGDAAGWTAAGLAGPAAPRQSIRPGDVPFVIPRGLCEPGKPVQTFE